MAGILWNKYNDMIDDSGLYDQALFRALSQLVKRMGPGEETNALLGTPLLPYLIRAFGHASADVRKAVSALSLRHILRASPGPVKKACWCLLSIQSADSAPFTPTWYCCKPSCVRETVSEYSAHMCASSHERLLRQYPAHQPVTMLTWLFLGNALIWEVAHDPAQVVFCLVELRLAVDEAKLAPSLAELTTTQQKLLAIYVERSQQQQQMSQQQMSQHR